MVLQINYRHCSFSKITHNRSIKKRHEKLEIINCSSIERLLDKDKESKGKAKKGLKKNRISENVKDIKKSIKIQFKKTRTNAKRFKNRCMKKALDMQYSRCSNEIYVSSDTKE